MIEVGSNLSGFSGFIYLSVSVVPGLRTAESADLIEYNERTDLVGHKLQKAVSAASFISVCQ
jgi:hypothetical protein